MMLRNPGSRGETWTPVAVSSVIMFAAHQNPTIIGIKHGIGVEQVLFLFSHSLCPLTMCLSVTSNHVKWGQSHMIDGDLFVWHWELLWIGDACFSCFGSVLFLPGLFCLGRGGTRDVSGFTTCFRCACARARRTIPRIARCIVSASTHRQVTVDVKAPQDGQLLEIKLQAAPEGREPEGGGAGGGGGEDGPLGTSGGRSRCSWEMLVGRNAFWTFAS